MNSENNTIEKTLFIPMEIFDRELGGALTLSKVAIENNWRVIIGGKSSIFPYLSKFRNSPGVFFLKSIVPGETHIQKKIIDYGHKITSLDVEGLVPSAGTEGVKIRYSKESINLSDYLFFWGRSGYETVKSVFPSIKEKSDITGSPIIDYFNIISKSKKKPNLKTILIATSCGSANHISGTNYSKRALYSAAKNLSDVDKAKIEEELLLDEFIFNYWKDFVPMLAKKFYDYKIILRPHPSESKIFWVKYFKNFSNISIERGGPITDSILNSSAFIHYNSTAAVTSVILNTPTFMPIPRFKKDFKEKLSFVKELSHTFESFDDFCDLFKKRGIKLNDESKNLLLSNAINYNDIDYASAEKIIKKYEKLFAFNDKKEKIKKTFFREYLKHKKDRFFYLLQWIIAIFLTPLEGILQILIPKKMHSELFRIVKLLPPRNSYKYAKTKQPIISNLEIEEIFKNIGFNNFKVQRIAKKLFTIERLS